MRFTSAPKVRRMPDAAEPLASAEGGMALITVIMVMMLVSALMIGFVSAIIADNRSSGLDHDQTQAYAAAHAGLEKLTSDLSGLFGGDVSPGKAQIDLLLANKPTVAGFKFKEPDDTTGYKVTWDFTKANGDPDVESTIGSTITHGPYQGFKGLITPYNIVVTARSDAGGAEVRMKRTLQTIAVPVFQFGVFSETDLAFHAGETFTFGGRVHTNGNLYLAEANTFTLTISDRVTAVGDVIRTNLPNGLPVTSGYEGVVQIPTTIMSNPVNNIYRSLATTEGSIKGTVGSLFNPNWTNLSIGTYNSNIRNGPDGAKGGTGAKRLDLPIVSEASGAMPIDLIRRPAQDSNESVTDKLLYQQRYFGMRATSLRILLSDTPAEIMKLPTIDASKAPVDLGVGTIAYAGGFGVAATLPPLARSVSPLVADGPLAAGVYKSTGAWLVNGVIKIEMQKKDAPGTWQDVTAEILSLGIAGKNLATNTPATALATRWNLVGPSNCVEPNPNAIIRLQRVRDVPFNTTTANTVAMQNTACGYTAPTVSPAPGTITVVSNRPSDYWPNALYDTREGQVRDNIDDASTAIVLGGVMHYVELDMANLKRWLSPGGIPGALSGANAMNENGNGFVVYFSDRRNNKSGVAADCPPTIAAPCETGEYGNEDTINPTTGNGLVYDFFDKPWEDANTNTRFDVYGKTARNVPTALELPVAPFDLNAVIKDTTTALSARANRPLFFRRALKIVNGGLGNIITPGLTIASENPVYIQGDFNASPAALWTAAHAATAIIADSVTTLSNAWNDLNSFKYPTDSTQRQATSTAYRVAIVSGKGKAFPQPAGTSSSFGSDGGVHNFMRNLEDWDALNATHRYRGSLVSFFVSRQATGSFKCCFKDAYNRGPRDWTFDSDFLIPSLLPPGTPMFRDINTLTFRQMLRPNQ